MEFPALMVTQELSLLQGALYSIIHLGMDVKESGVLQSAATIVAHTVQDAIEIAKDLNPFQKKLASTVAEDLHLALLGRALSAHVFEVEYMEKFLDSSKSLLPEVSWPLYFECVIACEWENQLLKIWLKLPPSCCDVAIAEAVKYAANSKLQFSFGILIAALHFSERLDDCVANNAVTLLRMAVETSWVLSKRMSFLCCITKLMLALLEGHDGDELICGTSPLLKPLLEVFCDSTCSTPLEKLKNFECASGAEKCELSICMNVSCCTLQTVLFDFYFKLKSFVDHNSHPYVDIMQQCMSVLVDLELIKDDAASRNKRDIAVLRSRNKESKEALCHIVLDPHSWLQKEVKESMLLNADLLDIDDAMKLLEQSNLNKKHRKDIAEVIVVAFEKWSLEFRDKFVYHYYCMNGVDDDLFSIECAPSNATVIFNTLVTDDEHMEMNVTAQLWLCLRDPRAAVTKAIRHALDSHHIEYVVQLLHHIYWTCQIPIGELSLLSHVVCIFIQDESLSKLEKLDIVNFIKHALEDGKGTSLCLMNQRECLIKVILPLLSPEKTSLFAVQVLSVIVSSTIKKGICDIGADPYVVMLLLCQLLDRVMNSSIKNLKPCHLVLKEKVMEIVPGIVNIISKLPSQDEHSRCWLVSKFWQLDSYVAFYVANLWKELSLSFLGLECFHRISLKKLLSLACCPQSSNQDVISALVELLHEVPSSYSALVVAVSQVITYFISNEWLQLLSTLDHCFENCPNLIPSVRELGSSLGLKPECKKFVILIDALILCCTSGHSEGVLSSCSVSILQSYITTTKIYLDEWTSNPHLLFQVLFLNCLLSNQLSDVHRHVLSPLLHELNCRISYSFPEMKEFALVVLETVLGTQHSNRNIMRPTIGVSS